jgi:hypothetical protein
MIRAGLTAARELLAEQQQQLPASGIIIGEWVFSFPIFVSFCCSVFFIYVVPWLYALLHPQDGIGAGVLLFWLLLLRV